MKPGSPLEQVQQGITEVIDELAFRLASSLNEKDVQNNLDKYEVRQFYDFHGWDVCEILRVYLVSSHST